VSRTTKRDFRLVLLGGLLEWLLDTIVEKNISIAVVFVAA
jgi:hypothetical protein